MIQPYIDVKPEKGVTIMSIKNLRFLLKEVEIYYDGDEFASTKKPKKAKERLKDNLVEASLEYPRSGTPSITTVKMLDLPSRKKVTLNTKDFWVAGLFKEDIDTETRFTLSVSDKDNISKFSLWFRRVFSLMFSTAASAATSGTTNLFQGAIASDLQTKLKEGFKGSQEDSSIKLLCKSETINIELMRDGVKAYYLKGKKKISVLNDAGDMVIELTAAKDFVKRGKAKRTRGSVTKTRKDILMFEKGQKLGEATVKLEMASSAI